jgi:phosphatidylglycerol---prolipoprotein diacylglyceryl transferase
MARRRIGFTILPVSLTPAQLHTLFEATAYAVGFRLFLRERRRFATTAELALSTRLALIMGAILGAAIGSRLSWWLEDPLTAFAHFPDALALMQGKSILGGLLGGVVGVEIAKWRTGVRDSTGDAFVWPIVVALIIGRIGCHLTGLDDHTAGLPTRLPWAWDFGDGIGRHPTALYEIGFLLIWGSVLALLAARLNERGDRFRLLMLGYLGFRFGVEYLKPLPFAYPFGLSGLQWLCVAGMVYYVRYMPRILRTLRGRTT